MAWRQSHGVNNDGTTLNRMDDNTAPSRRGVKNRAVGIGGKMIGKNLLWHGPTFQASGMSPLPTHYVLQAFADIYLNVTGRKKDSKKYMKVKRRTCARFIVIIIDKKELVFPTGARCMATSSVQGDKDGASQEKKRKKTEKKERRPTVVLTCRPFPPLA